MPSITGRTLQLDKVIEEALALGASDVDLAPDMPIIYRIDGCLRSNDDHVVTNDDTYTMNEKYLGDQAIRQKYEARKSYDISLAPGEDFEVNTRVRVHFYESKGNTCLSCRLVPLDPKPMEDLGIPPVLKKWMQTPGIILVSGDFGVGKTTTLSSMVDHINRSEIEKIMILEDPVEYLHKCKKSFIFQREVGLDSPSYADALRDVLREYVDTVVIGEIRNVQTMEAVFAMAESGMKVFTSIHARSAVHTIDRIANLFAPADYETICKRLSCTLNGICYQQLVPKKGGGRVLAAEILTMDERTREALALADKKEISASLKEGSEKLCSLVKYKDKLIEQGIIS